MRFYLIFINKDGTREEVSFVNRDERTRAQGLIEIGGMLILRTWEAP